MLLNVMNNSKIPLFLFLALFTVQKEIGKVSQILES